LWALLVALFCMASNGCTPGESELSAICHAQGSDCGCTTDADCTITQYYRDVLSDDDCCYPYICCAPGRPLNVSAAARNESNYEDAHCQDRNDLDCGACEAPAYEYWPTCQDGCCVSMRRRIR